MERVVKGGALVEEVAGVEHGHTHTNSMATV